MFAVAVTDANAVRDPGFKQVVRWAQAKRGQPLPLPQKGAQLSSRLRRRFGRGFRSAPGAVLELEHAELIERHIDLGLQPPQRSRIAFARDLAQALSPQRRLHFGVQVGGRRFGLIG